MNSDFVVRDFELLDHPEVLLLAKRAWLHTYSGILDKASIEEKVNSWYSQNTHEGMYWNMKHADYFFKLAYCCEEDYKLEKELGSEAD